MEEFKRKGYYPAGGRSQTSSAGSITYNNANSGLESQNVQDAIDEIDDNIDNLTASDVAYDNTTSSLEATDVQGAIDKLASVSSPADYVIDQGVTDDGWTFRIWNNGTYECWISKADVTNSTPFTYPIEFAALPIITLNALASSTYQRLINFSSPTVNGFTPVVGYWNNGGTLNIGGTVTVHCYVIGRWK